MADYINRQKLIGALRPYYFKHSKLELSGDIILAKDDTLSDILSEIQEQPRANVLDFLEIARCRNCRHYDKLNEYCNNFGFDPPSEDFYCRDGEWLQAEVEE